MTFLPNSLLQLKLLYVIILILSSLTVLTGDTSAANLPQNAGKVTTALYQALLTNASVKTLASFVVQNGQPGAHLS